MNGGDNSEFVDFEIPPLRTYTVLYPYVEARMSRTLTIPENSVLSLPREGFDHIKTQAVGFLRASTAYEVLDQWSEVVAVIDKGPHAHAELLRALKELPL